MEGMQYIIATDKLTGSRREISFATFKECPNLILDPSHWLPVHDYQSCGGKAEDVVQPKERAAVQKKSRSSREVHPRRMNATTSIRDFKKSINRMSGEYYEDKELECVERDCPNDGVFIFTGGEQKFLHNLEGQPGRDGKPMTYIEPRRCPECRKRKKEFFKNKQQFGT